jgi:hypothetical protein
VFVRVYTGYFLCLILYPAFFMPIVLDLSAPDDGTATAADASSPRYRLSTGEDPDSGGGGDKSGGGGVMPSMSGGGGDVAAVGDVPAARSGNDGVEMSGGGEVDTSGGG